MDGHGARHYFYLPFFKEFLFMQGTLSVLVGCVCPDMDPSTAAIVGSDLLACVGES